MYVYIYGFPGSSDGKESACSAGDLGSIPGMGRSSGEGNGNPHQYSFFFFNWKLITLQYRGGFCHTLTWISHECTCVPHPETPSNLPPHPIPLGCPSVLALSAPYFVHWTWTGHLFHSCLRNPMDRGAWRAKVHGIIKSWTQLSN